MFSSKKKLNKEIDRLKAKIEELHAMNSITNNQRLIAESKARNAKTVTDYWKTQFKNVEQENEKLKTQMKINNNYIKKLEKEILIQRQTIKNKDEYISILHNDATLYTTVKTRLQNSQLKDKLDRISAIVNED